ncbi:MAG TPA: PPOX class F420-dependent oxidoreductase [Herpetosiphonaceae bacterium]
MLSEQIRSFLEAPRFAVLATINLDGTPHQSVVWYDVQGDEIMMNTAEGRVKFKNVERDSRISVCIEDGYRYLTITGTAIMIDDQAVAQADAAILATRYFPQEVADAWVTKFQSQQRVTLRMTIDRVVTYGCDE